MPRQPLSVPLSPVEKQKLERLAQAEAMPSLAATIRRLIMLATEPTPLATPGLVANESFAGMQNAKGNDASGQP